MGGPGWPRSDKGHRRPARWSGPCRSNGRGAGEPVPAGLGELAGDLHPGDPGAPLLAQPLLGVLVVVAVAGWRAAWVAASISAQGRYGGPLLASGPRWSRRPDWDTRGPSPLEPPSCLGEGTG